MNNYIVTHQVIVIFEPLICQFNSNKTTNFNIDEEKKFYLTYILLKIVTTWSLYAQLAGNSS